VELDTLKSFLDVGAGKIHTDAYCRYFIDRFYVVNARGRDNIQVLDPGFNFVTVMEISMKENSSNVCNPHDISPCGSGRACVTRYDDSELWFIDLSTGTKYGQMDLSSYGYDGNNPHMHTLYYDEANDRIFVSLQRLDSSYKPSDYSSVLVIRASTMTVEKEIKLTWNDGGTDVFATNPYTYFRRVASAQWNPGDGHDHLLISCVGKFGHYYQTDCGIVAIDLTDLEVEQGYVITESGLGGEVNDFVVTSEGRGFAVISDDELRTHLVEFSLPAGQVSGGIKIKTIRSNGDSYGALGYVALRESTDAIYYGDRMATDPGVRVYDTVNDAPVNNDNPVYVGLPPAGLCLIE
jgi:hypothetical protein